MSSERIGGVLEALQEEKLKLQKWQVKYKHAYDVETETLQTLRKSINNRNAKLEVANKRCQELIENEETVDSKMKEMNDKFNNHNMKFHFLCKGFSDINFTYSKAKKVVEELTDVIQKERLNINTLNQEISELESDVEKEIDINSVKVREEKNALRKLTIYFNETNAKRNAGEVECQQLRNEINNVDDEILHISGEIEQQRTIVIDIDDEIDKKDRLMDNLKCEFEQEKHEIEQVLRSTKEGNDSRESEINAITEQLPCANDDLNAEIGKKNTNMVQWKELEEKNDDLKKVISKMEEVLQLESSKYSDTDFEQKLMSNNFEKLQIQLDEKRKDVKNLTVEIENAEKELLSLEKTYDEKEKKVEFLVGEQQKVVELTSDVESQEHMMKSSENVLDQLRQVEISKTLELEAMPNLKNKHDKLTDEIKQMNQRIEELKEGHECKISAMETELAELEKVVSEGVDGKTEDRSNSDIENLENEIQDLKQKFKMNETELKRMKENEVIRMSELKSEYNHIKYNLEKQKSCLAKELLELKERKKMEKRVATVKTNLDVGVTYEMEGEPIKSKSKKSTNKITDNQQMSSSYIKGKKSDSQRENLEGDSSYDDLFSNIFALDELTSNESSESTPVKKKPSIMVSNDDMWNKCFAQKNTEKHVEAIVKNNGDGLLQNRGKKRQHPNRVEKKCEGDVDNIWEAPLRRGPTTEKMVSKKSSVKGSKRLHRATMDSCI